ncbi:MAG TPA: metal ABC transporter permease [Candidatus Hydrogenedentes bacterium]|nr:metal ABC transporter permease [Candidatus Hydrogenedentota bacterium]
MADAFWIILVGALAASACGVIGCFLVLRRQAMMGDAISHGVLPGIVIAFVMTGSRNIAPMFLAAGAMGLLTAFLTDVLARRGRLQSDAAMGVTFTWLFAVGVILVTRYADAVDLDVECVLYGEILFTPFNRFEWGGFDLGPKAVWTTGAALAANAVFLTLGYPKLKLCTFDPGLAAALGVRVALWHYLLMAFTSMTTVACFESVGAVLVVAMLIAPANTAYLLTDRLSIMLAIAAVVGVISAVSGYLLAYQLDGAIAAGMTVTSGALFALAALFSPRHGVVTRAWRRVRVKTPG